LSENIAELTELLREMEAINPNIQGSAIVSFQGLPICSTLSRDVNEGIVSAICAAILSVSKGVVKELDRGDLKRILIEGDEGIIILSKTGPNYILCTLAKSDASLGMFLRYFNNKPPKMKDAVYVE